MDGSLGEACLLLVYRHGIKPHRSECVKNPERQSATPLRKIQTPLPLVKNVICVSRLLSRHFLSLGIHFNGTHCSLARIVLATRVAKHLHLIVSLQFWHFRSNDPSILLKGVDPNCVIWLRFHQDQCWSDEEIGSTPNLQIAKSHSSKKTTRATRRCFQFWMRHFALDPSLVSLHLGLLPSNLALPSFPSHLRRLSLSAGVNRNLRGLLPPTITHLTVGPGFNHPFGPVDLPHLCHFHVLNCPIDRVPSPGISVVLFSLSSQLRCLKMMSIFHEGIDDFHRAVFRFSNLQKLMCHSRYPHSSAQSTMPSEPASLFTHPTLRQIQFLDHNFAGGFLSQVDWTFWPLDSIKSDHLVSLLLPPFYCSSLSLPTFPSSLRRLVFHPNHDRIWFNVPLNSNIFPSGLTTLFFNDNFNQSIDHLELALHLTSLKRLRLGPQFNQPIRHLPPSLAILIVGDTPLCTPKSFPSLNLANELDPSSLLPPFTLFGRSKFHSTLRLSTLPCSLRLIIVGPCQCPVVNLIDDPNPGTTSTTYSLFTPPGFPFCHVIGSTDLFSAKKDHCVIS